MQLTAYFRIITQAFIDGGVPEASFESFGYASPFPPLVIVTDRDDAERVAIAAGRITHHDVLIIGDPAREQIHTWTVLIAPDMWIRVQGRQRGEHAPCPYQVAQAAA